MPLTDRVARLKQQSLEAVPVLSPERAQLMTDFYAQTTGLLSTPVRRALSFQYLLEHKAICIQPGELIVGEKGPAPQGHPHLPGAVLPQPAGPGPAQLAREDPLRGQIAETRALYAERIIPFWQGRSLRELIFQEMTPEWLAAYEAGIFTEFMEQRAPGHTVLDDKIYRKGMLDFIARDRRAAWPGWTILNDPRCLRSDRKN